MARKITKRQQQIYDFIKEYQQEKGYPPSVREMASAVGLSSPAPCTPISLPWRRAGYSSAMPPNRAPWNSLTKTVPLSQFLNLTSPPHLAERSLLPLVGRVAAGFPILAEQNIEDTFTIPTEIATDQGSFTLRCMELNDQCRHLHGRLHHRP